MDWSAGDTSKSFGRDRNSTDIDNTGDSKTDFKILSPTKGLRNDSIPPGKITDLIAVTPSLALTVTLSWTAPGDDEREINNTKGYYKVFFATYPLPGSLTEIMSSNYNYRIIPNPLNVGSREQRNITGLQKDTTYYFAIITYDSVGNHSELSNIATGWTLPDATPPEIDSFSKNFILSLSTIAMMGNQVVFSIKQISEDYAKVSTVKLVYTFDLSQSPTTYILQLPNITSFYYVIPAKELLGKTSLYFMIEIVNDVGLKEYLPPTATYQLVILTDNITAGPVNGIIKLPDGNPFDGETQIETTENVVFTIRQLNSLDPTKIHRATREKEIKVYYNNGLPVVAYEIVPHRHLTKPAKLTLLYLDVDNNGIPENINGENIKDMDEKELQIYKWNGYDWEFYAGKIDTQKNTITIEDVRSFSIYGIFAFSGEATIQPKQKFLTPNNDGVEDEAIFDFAKEVVIYDVTGFKIWSAMGDGSGQIKWRGESYTGNIVESGPYLYKAVDKDNKVVWGVIIVVK